jgi:hypothetical protein
VAALPPQPPGNQPPEPPGFAPPGYVQPGVPPPIGPPPAPYPGGAYTGQMPAQQYAQPAPVVVKVHKRTFWLTIAQIIMIVLALVRMLIGLAFVGFGVYILVAGSSKLASLPGYDQYFTQFGQSVVNLAAAFFFIVGVPILIIGIIDLVLGIVVGRPSNAARWIIVVLDVLSLIGFIDALARASTSTGTLIVIVLLVCKVIVFYAMVLDPPTRRNFAGTSR